jgi:hypothetical protein
MTFTATTGKPGEAATVKVTTRLTPAYRAWIDRARFCVLDDGRSGGHRWQPPWR